MEQLGTSRSPAFPIFLARVEEGGSANCREEWEGLAVPLNAVPQVPSLFGWINFCRVQEKGPPGASLCSR